MTSLIIIAALSSCGSTAVIPADAPDIALCLLSEDGEETEAICERIKSRKKFRKRLPELDAYLLVSQRDFLIMRKYINSKLRR